MTKHIASLVLLSSLAAAATGSTQALPKVWNRSADWVDKVNPGKDGKGNVVWYYSLHNGYRPFGMAWSPVWGGWIGHGAAKFTDSAVVSRGNLVHMARWDFWKVRYGITPLAVFWNRTDESFRVRIHGKLGVGWSGQNGKSHNTTVTVTIQHVDASKAKVTDLLKRVVAKPHADDTIESLSFDVSLPELLIEPSDKIQWTVFSDKPSGATESWILLGDKRLSITRTAVVARETPRYAKSRNPTVLNRGKTSRPIVGKVWDPFVSSPNGAVADVMFLGAAIPEVTLPFGTLLCTPSIVLTGKPNTPFPIAIPNDAALICAPVSAQGGSVLPNASLRLSNALDVLIGDI